MTDKELLEKCRIYVMNAHWVAETMYEDPESELFDDPRVEKSMLDTAELLAEIEFALATKH